MLSPKYLILIILIAIILGSLAGFLVYQYKVRVAQPEIPVPPEILPPPELFEPVAFELKTEIKNNKVFLKWPEEIRVVRVALWNLGEIGDPEDHKIVFDIATLELEPEIFLKPPYQIGTIPQGFIDITPEKREPIFVKGARYLVEAYGREKGKGEMLVAYHNFSF